MAAQLATFGPQITAEFSSEVDIDVTTDLPALWESEVRAFIFDELATVGGRGVAIESVKPAFHFFQNMITATVIGFVQGTSLILSREVETEDNVEFGKIIRYIHPENVEDDEESESPAPTQGYVYQTNRTITRIVR